MEWAPIQGFPGYSVNALGQVRNDSRESLVRPRINQYGTVFVGLFREWEQKQRSLALIVARAFLDPPPEAFDTPINIDGDRFNCAADNLMWRPRWFAVKFNRQFRERYDNPINAPIKDVEHPGEIYRSSLDVAKRFGLLERDVVLSIENRTYVWPTYQLFDIAG